MTSDLKFGEESTGTEVATAFASRIQGKTVVITGVSPGGIGETTALGFALGQPKTLVLASRTKVNLEAVAGAIGMKYPKVDVKIVLVDFASQESVRAAAADVKKLVSKIDILVNNAAVVPHSRKWTAEHIELQFGANHIGHFLFTNLLLPLLREAAKDASPGDTRIINVSSGGHNLSPIRFHDYNFEGKPIPDEEKPNTFRGNGMNLNNTSEDGYPFFVAYGQCKTANILFSLYLQEHLKSAGITSYALHPGTITTKLGRDSAPPKPGEKKFPPPEWKTKTLDGGASTTLFAALDPDLNESKGVYLSDCAIVEPAAHARNSSIAERLWDLSEELVGEKFSIA